MESTYEINAEQLKQIVAQLGEIPAKYSANLLMFFAQLQPVTKDDTATE